MAKLPENISTRTSFPRLTGIDRSPKEISSKIGLLFLGVLGLLPTCNSSSGMKTAINAWTHKSAGTVSQMSSPKALRCNMLVPNRIKNKKVVFLPVGLGSAATICKDVHDFLFFTPIFVLLGTIHTRGHIYHFLITTLHTYPSCCHLCFICYTWRRHNPLFILIFHDLFLILLYPVTCCDLHTWEWATLSRTSLFFLCPSRTICSHLFRHLISPCVFHS